MMASQGAVVFGGAGFIGGHLLARLQKAGVAPLYSIDLRPPDPPLAGVCYLYHDCRELSALSLAAPVDLAFDLVPPADPEIIDTALSISAFLRRHRIARLVYLSSLAVYGHGGAALSEQSPPAPQRAQAWAQWRAEGIYRGWQSETDPAAERRLVICRAGELFGAKAPATGEIARMAAQMARGAVIYPGRKDLLCPCYYIGDLIDALFYALAQEESDVLFNACYRERTTLGEIGALLKAHAFPQAREIVLPWLAVLLLARQRGRGALAEGFAARHAPHDVLPGWLDARGRAKPLGLEAGLRRWIDSDPAHFPQGLQGARIKPALAALRRGLLLGGGSRPAAIRGAAIRRVAIRRVFRPNGR